MFLRARLPVVLLGALMLAACAPMPRAYPDQPGVDPGAAARPAPVYADGGLPPPVYVPRQRTTGSSLYFYPAQGQDDARQDRDRYECYRWAVSQTGVDPGMTPVREVPPPARRVPSPPRDADVAAGAITGAVVGGALSSRGHGPEGAVIGAIFGALLGASAGEARQQAEAAARSREAARAAYAQRPLDDFRRAMTACMEGRGYRVR